MSFLRRIWNSDEGPKDYELASFAEDTVEAGDDEIDSGDEGPHSLNESLLSAPSSRLFGSTFFLFLGAAIGLLLSVTLRLPPWMMETPSPPSAPNLPIRYVAFEHNGPMTKTLASDTSNMIINAPMPSGGGYVALPAGNHASVADSVRIEGGEYRVSVYRALECLNAVRSSYLNSISSDPSPNRMTANHVLTNDCFGYLRQYVACAADATLEPVDTMNRDETGWGVLHRCRDLDTLREWTEEHASKVVQNASENIS